MQLNSEDLKKISYVAIAAATVAGQHIRHRLKDEIKVHKKETGDSLAAQLVTNVDFESQDFIFSELSNSFDEYDLGFLFEEDEDEGQRFEKDYFWCVDPLDGTLQFTESRKGYAVSIALVSREGEPVIGVVFDPFEENLYYAVKGTGAFLNHEVWKLKEEQSGEPTIIDEGGAVMNALWAIEQAPAVFYKHPKPVEGGGCIWDYAAITCIFKEMGAWASDSYGNPLELNRKESPFMNHKGVLFATNKTIAEQFLLKEES